MCRFVKQAYEEKDSNVQPVGDSINKFKKDSDKEK
jgi:hypothetical protein